MGDCPEGTSTACSLRSPPFPQSFCIRIIPLLGMTMTKTHLHGYFHKDIYFSLWSFPRTNIAQAFVAAGTERGLLLYRCPGLGASVRGQSSCLCGRTCYGADPRGALSVWWLPAAASSAAFDPLLALCPSRQLCFLFMLNASPTRLCFPKKHLTLRRSCRQGRAA